MEQQLMLDAVSAFSKRQQEQCETQCKALVHALSRHSQGVRGILEATVEPLCSEGNRGPSCPDPCVRRCSQDGGDPSWKTSLPKSVPSHGSVSGELQRFSEDDRHSIRSTSRCSDQKKRLRQDFRAVEAQAHLNENGMGCLGRFCPQVSNGTKKRRWFSMHVHTLVESGHFQVLATILILADAVFVGLSSDHLVQKALSEFDARAHHASVLSTPGWIGHVDKLFTITFTVELVFRLIAQEGRLFMGPDWKWIVCDFALVLSSLFDMTITSVNANMKHMRTLRGFSDFSVLSHLYSPPRGFFGLPQVAIDVAGHPDFSWTFLLGGDHLAHVGLYLFRNLR